MPHLTDAAFWSSGYGLLIGKKSVLFAVVLIVSGIHDFWLGPKAAVLMDEDPDHPRTRRLRSASKWAGRVNLLLGLAIVYIAVTLVR